MPQQQDVQHAQVVSCNEKPMMEMQKLERMENPPFGMCYATMCVFGGLVIIGLITQIVLQHKSLKQLHRISRK